MEQFPKLKVIISGGGTGGHIFPAIAIANQLKFVNNHTTIHFVGALGKMEMQKVPEAGYEITGLNIAGFQRSLSFQNLLLPLKIFFSIVKSIALLKRLKPHVAVGVGGYASGPLLFAASLLRIPTVIQEQNSYAGITNKILAKRASLVCVAYYGMEKFFEPAKIVVTGNPIRELVKNLQSEQGDAIAKFNLLSQYKTILILGGSLGARSINLAVTALLPFFKEHNIQLIWQTGKLYASTASNAAINYSNVFVAPFINNMNDAYAAANIIVSRAGAGTISELCMVGKPAVLVPSPNVAEDHQTKNALALVKDGAAEIIPDHDLATKLAPLLTQLINNPEHAASLAKNIKNLALPNAAAHIVDQIYKVARP
jgi:UDP-N-acetylglucosamine--N-acetylmuramyl-(pentapeptide) pyrophosphoryl-undecaprenol N-acetylglucosamine transferase